MSAIPGAGAARPAESATRRVTVLGSTGSVGTQTLDLLAEAPAGRFEVEALVGGRRAAALAAQARRFGARLAVIADPACWPELSEALAGSGIEAACGPRAVVEAAARGADWTMAAITGAAGLHATMAAIACGRTVALANKEALVCAGAPMLAAVRASGATLLPVDSEHNAIFQALAEGNRGAVERITLTASGGPFRTATMEEMARATPETALRHPVWSMGAKISIDSATMMNKGLEVIEAARLFDLPGARIDVLVHPQSVVHGMVHYADGSVLAQLGSPDMRVPIANTLAWPSRLATSARRLDLAAVGRLEFEQPDPVRFPALRLAREALSAGGAAACIMSAANEVAVEGFLGRRLGFLDIVAVAEQVLAAMGDWPAGTLDEVLAADAEARVVAARYCAERARSAA
jgi:1-deoxy-D-xylulose-5-phosphate reductoisomerase